MQHEGFPFVTINAWGRTRLGVAHGGGSKRIDDPLALHLRPSSTIRAGAARALKLFPFDQHRGGAVESAAEP